MPDKGLFVKELEEALRDGRAHLAVHSAKDLPGELPAGLAILAVPPREDPRDVVVGPFGGLGGLTAGATVATGSARRAAQILEARPDLDIVPIRGNVGTRLEKLEAGHADAIILAAAGLRRLGLDPEGAAPLPVDVSTPAPGQGLLAVEGRDDDPDLARAVAALDDAGRPRVPARRARAPGGAGRRLPAAGGRLLRARSRRPAPHRLRPVRGRHPLGARGARGPPLRPRGPRRRGGRRARGRPRMSGFVHLVGAGPGDPGLLTVAGRAALEAADVVVHDRLGTAELLPLCRPDADAHRRRQGPGTGRPDPGGDQRGPRGARPGRAPGGAPQGGRPVRVRARRRGGRGPGRGRAWRSRWSPASPPRSPRRPTPASR